ncbi:MAG: hypothetical protein ACLQDC_16705 [Verrucomicrobiia bacterium]
MSEPETASENLPVLVIHRTDEGPDWFAIVTSVGLSLALAPIPGGGAIQKVVETIVQLQRNRASQTMVEIADIVGSADVLLTRIEQNPELRDLLARSLEAAMRSSYEAKRRLLVMAVANAFQNDDAINPAILKEFALSQLEPVHIHALARLVDVASDPDLMDDLHRHDAMGIASEDMPVPVRAALIQTGTVIPSTMIVGGAVRIYDVSPFGHEIIQGLRDAGDESR